MQKTNLRILEEQGNYGQDNEEMDDILVGVNTRGQSIKYEEPTQQTEVEVPDFMQPKPKFNPNDPSTFQHCNLYKKWQSDSNIMALPPPKKKGFFDFSRDPSPPRIWYKMWDDRDSPALIAVKLK